MKKYQVIYDLYKESILSGILKYGDRVDSIRECVKKMNVSKTRWKMHIISWCWMGLFRVKKKWGMW